MALPQQEEDVGAEAEFGVGVLAVDPQEFVMVLCRQGEHLRGSTSIMSDSEPFSP